MKTIHLTIIIVTILISGIFISVHLPTASSTCIFGANGKPTSCNSGPYVMKSYQLPLQQVESGIPASDIQCKQDLELIFKAENGSPACVKPDTAQKLIERGWAKITVTIANLDVIESNMTQTNIVMGLGNDTGIVNWKNQTYYFETTNYTETESAHLTQILFHDVLFTLYPSTFAGIPLGGCEGTHYLTNAKFSDGTNEMLHVFVGSPSCGYNYTPIKLSTHANPQAGLIFYDGKMKLLTSVENK